MHCQATRLARQSVILFPLTLDEKQDIVTDVLGMLRYTYHPTPQRSDITRVSERSVQRQKENCYFQGDFHGTSRVAMCSPLLPNLKGLARSCFLVKVFGSLCQGDIVWSMKSFLFSWHEARGCLRDIRKQLFMGLSPCNTLYPNFCWHCQGD